MGHQIVRERAFLGDLAHEHRDRAAYRLIDINDEHLVVIAEKHRTPAACRQDRPHLHFDHSFVHEQTLSAGKRKTSGARRMGRIRFTRQMERASWVKFLGLRTCMLGALNHCALCGSHALRDLAK